MKFLVSVLFALFVVASYGQNSVAVANTRLVASCMLNDSSLAISASDVDVIVSPQNGEIYVEFKNTNARDMTQNAEKYYAKREFTFQWKATIYGLIEMLKNASNSVEQTEGTVELTIGNTSQELPITFIVEHVKGTQGVTKMATLKGSFDPNYFEMNSEKFKWDKEFNYSIIFRTTTF